MKRSDLNRLNHAYHRADVAADAESIERARDERPHMLVARIEGYTPIGTYRWLYSWSLAEIQPTSVGGGYKFDVRSGENWYVGQALNVCEGFNSGGYVGPGIDPANIPAGFDVQPITGYVILFPQNRAIVTTPGVPPAPDTSEGGEEMWVFYAPNAIDGQCTTPLVGDTDYGTYFFPGDLDDEYGYLDAPEGDTDFGTINLSDYGSYVNPNNDNDYLTFFAPYANTVDYGGF